MGLIRTALLLGLLTGILLLFGFLWAGVFGMTIFLGLAFLMNFIAFWYSDKIILKIYRAKQISKQENPKLHEIVERLAHKAKIPKPKVYRVDMTVPNAFATGRSPKHGVVAVTDGLMKNLGWDEIEGVVAHEIAHIKHRDTLTSAVAATIGGAISYMAYIAWWSLFSSGGRGGNGLILLPLLILAPLAAMIVQMAISRVREFKADYTGGIISGKPLSLASALKKISHIAKNYPLQGNSAVSHLFIINPFKPSGISKLFSTHPPVEARVERLEKLAEEIK